MNVTSVKTKYYENKQPFRRRQNEPKTNPIKANLRENEPNFAKNEPNFKPNLPAKMNRTLKLLTIEFYCLSAGK